MRTFRLFVAEGDRTIELRGLIAIVVRFTAFFLLVLLVINVVATTDVHAENRRL